MLAPASSAAENPLVVGNPIARGGGFAYQRHGMILSLRPRFAPGPFSFGNCCYRGSCRPGLLLGERALEELPERYCARGNFRPRAAPVLERLIQWPLQSDLDGSAGLYRRDIGVIGHVHLMRGTGARYALEA